MRKKEITAHVKPDNIFNYFEDKAIAATVSNVGYMGYLQKLYIERDIKTFYLLTAAEIILFYFKISYCVKNLQAHKTGIY